MVKTINNLLLKTLILNQSGGIRTRWRHNTLTILISAHHLVKYNRLWPPENNTNHKLNNISFYHYALTFNVNSLTFYWTITYSSSYMTWWVIIYIWSWGVLLWRGKNIFLSWKLETSIVFDRLLKLFFQYIFAGIIRKL